MDRLTRRLLSYSRVRNWVGVGCQGGKIRLGGGEQLLDVLVNGGLVVFGGQQIVSPGLEHRRAGGLGLRVQGIERDKPAFRWSWFPQSRWPDNIGWARRWP